MGLNLVASFEARNLAALELTASTARVLNLRKVFEVHGREEEYVNSPFFRNKLLNRSILLKHRLRGSEQSEFVDHRTVATKILVPIDPTDLKKGAFYVYVDQKNFEALLSERLSKTGFELTHDISLLKIIDKIPSLDPFLLREYLDREGVKPANCYFKINEADVARMRSFVEKEIGELVKMSFGDTGDIEKAKILTTKLLSNSGAQQTESLRMTLQMDIQQYGEGFFCWKAFLYYKWQLDDIITKTGEVIQEIKTVVPRGNASKGEKEEIIKMRQNIVSGINKAIMDVDAILATYDYAYRQLTQERNPVVFKEFLLSAPTRFDALGERLGAVQHLVSFWRYRVPNGRRPQMNYEELADLFTDFEGSLSVVSRDI